MAVDSFFVIALTVIIVLKRFTRNLLTKQNVVKLLVCFHELYDCFRRARVLSEGGNYIHYQATLRSLHQLAQYMVQGSYISECIQEVGAALYNARYWCYE